MCSCSLYFEKVGLKMQKQIKHCPYCNTAWLYVSDDTYGSAYESKGYKVNCMCNYAWIKIPWQKTEEAAIKEWNKAVEDNDDNK